MNPFIILLAIFFIVPTIEIYVLVKVGALIGPTATLSLVIFTAILGAFLVRAQGFSTLHRVKDVLDRGGVPALELMEGAVLLIAGALLLTPGFVTDTLGFLCLIPALRRTLIISLFHRIFHPLDSTTSQRSQQSTKTGARGSRTIEGEFHREDD